VGKEFKRSYGIEIEVHAPVGKTRAALAHAITAAGVSCKAIEYRDHYDHGGGWAIKTDRSVAADYGFEAVSPPLTGEEGFAQTEKVCAVLLQHGCQITSKCGLHVHIDARNPTRIAIESLRRLALLYVGHELLIDACMPASRRGKAAANGYAHGFAGVSANAIMACRDAGSLAQVMRPGRVPGGALREYRYVKLNFGSILTHGTVEFRHHGGTLEPEKIRNWVYACQRMVEYALRGEDQQVVHETRRVIATVRQGTKRAMVVDMLLRPVGCTHSEVLLATGWKQVSVADIAHCYGLTLRTESVYVSVRVEGARRQRETRYWGVRSEASERPTRRSGSVVHRQSASSLLEFCTRLGMDEDEIKFWQSRADMFARATLAVSSAQPQPDILTALRTGGTI
jgi:hypothetical protein